MHAGAAVQRSGSVRRIGPSRHSKEIGQVRFSADRDFRPAVVWSDMLPFADALQRIIESAPLLSCERVELGLGVGRVLAEDLTARAPLPGFDYSAMDGYAVAQRSFTGAGPWSLPVIGESRAGALAAPLVAGSACRI